MAEDSAPLAGVGIRGVIAPNAAGMLCFFAVGFSDGVPVNDREALLDAVAQAPVRRRSHTEIDVFLEPRGPEEM